MSEDRVTAAFSATAPEDIAAFAAMLASEPVGKLFDGAILRWIVARFGRILGGLDIAEIAGFLVLFGIPQPWAGLLAQMIYNALHPNPIPAPVV